VRVVLQYLPRCEATKGQAKWIEATRAEGELRRMRLYDPTRRKEGARLRVVCPCDESSC